MRPKLANSTLTIVGLLEASRSELWHKCDRDLSSVHQFDFPEKDRRLYRLRPFL